MNINYKTKVPTAKPNYTAKATQIIQNFLNQDEAVVEIVCTNLEEAKAIASPIGQICRHEYADVLRYSRTKNTVYIEKLKPCNTQMSPETIEDIIGGKYMDNWVGKQLKLKTIFKLCEEYGADYKGYPKLERSCEYGMLQYMGKRVTIMSRWKDSCLILEDKGKYAWHINNFEEE